MRHKETRGVSKYRFKKVKDARGHAVRGLWRRGTRFYAQLRVTDAAGATRSVRVPLEAATPAEAVAELEAKRVERRRGELVVVTHSPKLADAVATYKESAEFAAKRHGTRVTESGYLDKWVARLGQHRVNKIKTKQVIAVRDELAATGLHARTLNKYVVGLRNVLKFCKEREQLTTLPQVSRVKEPKLPRRTLLEDAQFRRLLDACQPEVTKNAQLFAYYLRFLALCGAREQEALRVRWADVNFQRKVVTIGADALSKNAEARDVNFSPELEALLQEMHEGRPPDCSWVFPSPQRGAKDIHAKSMKESMRLVREEAKLRWVGFHDLRHQFISKCVMAGVDFMTIAAWVGHKDGGVLIGKVYGHLSQDHKAETAKRLTFFHEA
jgi:integrase